jgi:small subunit ribosomal protein S16
VAVKIRLMRVGKKHQPTYRVVVADTRSPRDGRLIDVLGQYEPRRDPSGISIDGARALDWIEKGAQPTERVAKILEIAGVWNEYETKHGRPAAARPAPRRAAPARASAGPSGDAPA